MFPVDITSVRADGLKVMSVADAERFQAGRSHRPLVSLPYERTGVFRHPVTKPGEYRLVIDNRMEGRGPALVHVQLAAVFGDPMLEVHELPAGRRAEAADEDAADEDAADEDARQYIPPHASPFVTGEITALEAGATNLLSPGVTLQFALSGKFGPAGRNQATDLALHLGADPFAERIVDVA